MHFTRKRDLGASMRSTLVAMRLARRRNMPPLHRARTRFWLMGNAWGRRCLYKPECASTKTTCKQACSGTSVLSAAKTAFSVLAVSAVVWTCRCWQKAGIAENVVNVRNRARPSNKAVQGAPAIAHEAFASQHLVNNTLVPAGGYCIVLYGDY